MANYKDTLNLPATAFPMKANLPQLEPELLKRWEDEHVYQGMIAPRKKNAERYVFHDGPPYANGHLHLGTILNKILKDIVVKYKNMSGATCEFIPGWDCHGLPIELEAIKLLGEKKKAMSAVELRAACRAHAEKFIDIQRNEFKRLGVLARWDDLYLTMSKEYEATIAREFAHLVERESVYREKKPIHWCPSCVTALAEAEIEYEDIESDSIYVRFRLLPEGRKIENYVSCLKGYEDIFLVIWTTTPWTLPANKAVALNPQHEYVAIAHHENIFIVAKELAHSFCEAVHFDGVKEIGVFSARPLAGWYCRHPFLSIKSQVILSDHVTIDIGTGCVHIAPGHGQEDYATGIGKTHGILSPVDERGRFVNEAGVIPEEWVGQSVFKVNPLIIKKLEEKRNLLAADKIRHSYPHCWRCQKPVIFRATEQWFISMEKNDLRKKCLEAIQQVTWIPPWGQTRMKGMLEARPDWCISRQRSWGVPIVAFRCRGCREFSYPPKQIRAIAEKFQEHGSDYWFSDFEKEFLFDKACPKCGGEEWEKEHDILDVWFDSGVSYVAVLERAMGKDTIADLYLEGSDQHRGWFHTSLLTSIGTRGRAPYKRVLTHGFVVDGEGRKYSKSAKNYTPPEHLINQHGAEILRLWVAAEDYRDDIRFSDEIFARTIEAYRKIRNTCRFLLGNLADFDPHRDRMTSAELCEIDRWALHTLATLVARVREAYAAFAFHTITQALNRFCTVDLSSFYLDVIKDRLYTEKKDGQLRRSAQTTIWIIADTVVRLMAPILSFTAEEVWSYLPKVSDRSSSVFLATIPSEVEKYEDAKLGERWERLIGVRAAVTKKLEEARAAKTIGNPLEAKIVIDAPKALKEFLQSFDQTLPDLFLVSGVEFGKETVDLNVTVHAADGKKCARCWKYATSVGKHTTYADVCARCCDVLSTGGVSP